MNGGTSSSAMPGVEKRDNAQKLRSLKVYLISSLPWCILTFTYMQNLEQPKQSNRTGTPTKKGGTIY
jgi:hypothetical protein